MFIKNTISVFFVQILALIIAFVADVVVSRTLGPLGRGQLSLINAIVLTVWLISNIGLNNASLFFVAKEKSSKNTVIIISLLIQILTASISSLIVLALLPILEKTITRSEIPESVLALGLILIPFTAILNGIQSLLLGLGEIRKYNYSRVISSSLQLILYIFLWVSLRMNIELAVFAILSSVVIACIIGIVWLRRIVGRFKISLSIDLLKQLVAYGVKSWGGLVFQFLNYRLDVYIVNFFVGAVEVGYYAVAVGLAETIWYIPNATATILFPKIAADNQDAKSFTPRIARFTSIITIIAIFGLAILSYPVIILMYGKPFFPAVIPLLALLPGVFFLGIAKVLSSDLNGQGKPHCGTWSAFISIIVTILFDFLLIPPLGILGAAIASSLSYGSAFIVLVYFYHRYSGNSVISVILPTRDDFSFYHRFFKSVSCRYLQKSIN